MVEKKVKSGGKNAIETKKQERLRQRDLYIHRKCLKIYTLNCQ